MNYLFYISLFIFWTLFWSFWSVLIYRLYSKESGILNWRSHCAKCNHQLWFWDLIPIFSWASNLWKCKYCKEKISIVYPLLELSTWILFSLIWYFLIDYNLIINLNINEVIKLIFWLIIWFITILYTFYDLLFLEIHEWMMLSWIIIACLAIIFQSLWIINIIDTIPYNINIWNNYIAIIIFIITIISLYIIMLNNFNEFIDIAILIFIVILIFTFNKYFAETNIKNYTSLNALFWSLIIFIFFFIQYIIWVILHIIEKRTKKKEEYRFEDWIIWWGDLRIAILIWLLLWYTYSLSWLMLTYIVWTIISITIIIIWKIRNKEVNNQVPFWPFLAIWFFITIFYQQQINTLLKIYF